MNFWCKICKWFNDSDKLIGCFLLRLLLVFMKCFEWSCYFRFLRYLKFNECCLIIVLIWSYDVICLYGLMNCKINLEKIVFFCFYRWLFRVLCEIVLEFIWVLRVKVKGVCVIYFLKKKMICELIWVFR